MTFSANHLYHIYNRGNNKQDIFFNRDNYIYFLRKVRKFIMPTCDILSYCLMLNHFHLLVYSDDRTLQTKRIGNNDRNLLSEGIRNLLQTYSKAINQQNKTTGSLFQQNTKAKCVSEDDNHYGLICFHYIHQNAWKSGLVDKMENWDYCSFKDYAGFRNGTLCNQQLARELLDFDPKTFYNDSYKVVDDSLINFIR